MTKLEELLEQQIEIAAAIDAEVKKIKKPQLKVIQKRNFNLQL